MVEDSRSAGLVHSRMDCILVNESWLSKWPMAMSEHFQGGTSDHVVLITHLHGLEGSRRPFRVFNSWFAKDSVKTLVKESWKHYEDLEHDVR